MICAHFKIGGYLEGRALKQSFEFFFGHFAIGQDFKKKSRTEVFTSMNRNHRTAPVAVPQKVMTSLDANEIETRSLQSRKQFLAFEPGEPRHESDRNPLNADKLVKPTVLIMNFKTKRNRLLNAFHKCVQRLGLSVAAFEFWHGGDKVAFGIPFNNHIEFTLNFFSTRHGSILLPAVLMIRHAALRLQCYSQF